MSVAIVQRLQKTVNFNGFPWLEVVAGEYNSASVRMVRWLAKPYTRQGCKS